MNIFKTVGFWIFGLFGLLITIFSESGDGGVELNFAGYFLLFSFFVLVPLCAWYGGKKDAEREIKNLKAKIEECKAYYDAVIEWDKERGDDWCVKSDTESKESWIKYLIEHPQYASFYEFDVEKWKKDLEEDEALRKADEERIKKEIAKETEELRRKFSIYPYEHQ